MHIAGRTGPAAIDPISCLVVQAFAAERMGRRCQDVDFVIAAAAAPVLAGARRIDAEFLAMEHHRIELFIDFDIRHRQPAERADMADLVEPVAAFHCAGTGSRRPVIKHIGLFTVFAADRNAEDILRPARAAAIRVSLGQRLPDGMDDFMRKEHRAHRRWRAFAGVDNRPFGRDHVDTTERAFIMRQVRIEERRKRREDRRIGIAKR